MDEQNSAEKQSVAIVGDRQAGVRLPLVVSANQRGCLLLFSSNIYADVFKVEGVFPINWQRGQSPFPANSIILRCLPGKREPRLLTRDAVQLVRWE